VSNIVVLWDSLIAELDRQCRIVRWVKIPSHVGIEGNVEADRLVKLGRESSPLYHKNTGPLAHNRLVRSVRLTFRVSTPLPPSYLLMSHFCYWILLA